MRLRTSWTRRVLVLGLVILTLSAASEGHAEVKGWLGVRSGGALFTNSDPDDIEALATALSDPAPNLQLEFEKKNWEVPFGARLGLEFADWVRVFVMYERIPYLLEREPSVQSGLLAPTESIRFEAPANVFGGGVDVVLADAAYGQALVFGIATGTLEIDGKDQDVLFRQNFAVEGTGYYFELSLAGEFQFSDEVTFLPFLAWRVAKTTETSWARTRDLGAFDPPGEFEVDFTGITIGLEGRFQFFPWSSEDEEKDLPAGGRWE